VAQIMGSRPYSFVLPNELNLQEGGCDVAFVSRDVTGSSTKHDIKPETQAFYDAMLASGDLKWVHVHSAGIDRAVYTQLQMRGVRVKPSAGANASVVAQTALSGVLALSRRWPLLMQAQQQRQWLPLHGDLLPRDLAGQRITLVGWGAIAQTLAGYVQMLGLHVSVARHSGVPVPSVERTVSYAQLSELLPTTDWLVLACPLTEETRGLITSMHLQAMPRGAHLINVSRGEVVDEPALIAALQSNHLAGAYLELAACDRHAALRRLLGW
jgi:phosphoglycerate dehydrogenase-like enzyme